MHVGTESVTMQNTWRCTSFCVWHWPHFLDLIRFPEHHKGCVCMHPAHGGTFMGILVFVKSSWSVTYKFPAFSVPVYNDNILVSYILRMKITHTMFLQSMYSGSKGVKEGTIFTPLGAVTDMRHTNGWTDRRFLVNCSDLPSVIYGRIWEALRQICSNTSLFCYYLFSEFL